MAKGWIMLHRQLLDSDIWTKDNQPFDMRSAWIDLLLLANHEDKTTIIDYEPIVVKRGQLLTSIRQLSKRWSWSKERTLKYLRLLEKLEMITKNSNTRRTLLTIEKYDKFQSWQDTDEDTGLNTGLNANRTQTERNLATNNNVNNVNNEIKKNNNNNIYNNAFEIFWSAYPNKKGKDRAYKCYLARIKEGFTEEQLLMACQNYATYCERRGTEQRYIKHPSTFLSANKDFADFFELPEEELKPKPVSVNTKIHNYNERDYDFEELTNLALKKI